MTQDDVDALRRRAEHAYARWRACEAARPRVGLADEECVRLRKEYELADQAYLRTRGR